MKRFFLLCLCTFLLFCITGCSTDKTTPSSDWNQQTVQSQNFRYIGVYTWDPVVDFYPFFKACGINTVQLSDRSWYYNATAAQQALSLLDSVTPRTDTTFPFPESIADIFVRIQARLEALLLSEA